MLRSCVPIHFCALFNERVLTGGFEKHINTDHSPWNYLLYLHAMREQPVCDLTGTQTYVLNCLSRSSTEFLPVDVCVDTCFTDPSTETDDAGDHDAGNARIDELISCIESTKEALLATTERMNEMELRMNEAMEFNDGFLDSETEGPDISETEGPAPFFAGSFLENSAAVVDSLVVTTDGAGGETNDNNGEQNNS